MKATSERDRAHHLSELARKAFADHTLVSSTNARWVVARPESNIYRAEIVLLEYRRIIVHGDTKPVLFGGGSYCGEELLPWIAESDEDYLAGKVIAGTAYRWEPEIALWWVDSEIAAARERLREATDDEGCVDDRAHARATERIDGLTSVRGHLLRGDDEHLFRERLYEISGGDREFGASAGRAPSSDIFYAREAVRTLIRLRGHGS